MGYDRNNPPKAQNEKEGSVPPHLNEYREILGKILKRSNVLTEKDKEILRAFRIKYQITTEQQCQCLLEVGWTFDEYEVSLIGD